MLKGGESVFDLDEFFALLDLNGDGKISLEEFKQRWGQAGSTDVLPSLDRYTCVVAEGQGEAAESSVPEEHAKLGGLE